MKADFAGLTDQGLVRAINQDSYYADPNGRFFIVADGMGGHAAGQEASRIAKEAILSYLEEKWDSAEPSLVLLENAFLTANQAILADQQANPDNADMGTTAVVVMFRPQTSRDTDAGNGAWYANLGDSRLYRFRETLLEQVSEDDTWVAQAVKVGALSAEDSRTHPWRHVLSQCLGREDMGEIEVGTLPVQPGDRLLLCSDGLTEELTDEAISKHLMAVPVLGEAVAALIEAAKKEGGHDNITAILVKVDRV
jgi:protein phosphatase